MSNDVSGVDTGALRAMTPQPAPVRAQPEPAPQAEKKAEAVNKLETPEIDLTAQIEQLQSIVDRLNSSLEQLGRDLNFSVDQRLNKYVVVVQNKESGEIIRQIPDEEALRMAHRIEDLKGIIFSDDA
ncbi:MAG: flagellar protein FlaG [Pseudomonadota bacterium]|nr:flagellar protein FlaG [Pseudomonadota bacterium]